MLCRPLDSGMKGIQRKRADVFSWIALILITAIPGCTPSPPTANWPDAFGYTEADIHTLNIGDFGFPYIQVHVRETRLFLPFDTGNMVGLSVSPELFDKLGLTADDYYQQVNSAGKTVARLRVADSIEVSVFGRDSIRTRVYELNHSSLSGLAGPTLIEAGHFTLDYRTGRIGVGSGSLPDSVPGFVKLPLVRSERHPRLILVMGTIEGREVLLELDTGKSRTVINPLLASELSLRGDSHGVGIDRLRIGDLSFQVPSAKEVDQTAIDPMLPEPILAGVGSDILSRFVWTVDYEAGALWIPR